MASRARSASGPSKSSGADASTRFLCSSTAACIAELFTYPIDTTRVRVQMAGRKVGMLTAAKDILKTQGSRAFYRGMGPAGLRQFIQCGTNLCAYVPIRNALSADKDESLLKKGAAGALSGSFGQLCAIPTDVVKVKMQGDRKCADSGQAKYQNARHCLRVTLQEKGVLGMWRGATPACGRSAMIHSVGLSSYDGFKTVLVKKGGFSSESSFTHVASASVSGALASLAGCPFDVVKTRVMVQSQTPKAVLVHIMRHEGPRALFKGYLPTLSRLGPWQVMWLSCYERFCIAATGESKI